MKRHQYGVTLLELTIVMVIAGLLLSTIVKAKELVTNARCRDIIAQQTQITAAYYAFRDRYHALPGDMPGTQASRDIPNVAPYLGGDGNGTIQNGTTQEQTIAWTHLSQAGFLSKRYLIATPSDRASDVNTPRNAFQAFLQIAFDADFAQPEGGAQTAARHNLKTGNQIPAELLAEIDRKIDDGNPGRGSFRYSSYNGATKDPASLDCISAHDGTWNLDGAGVNCGGASFL